MLQLAILLMFLPLITWQCQPLELAVIMTKELKLLKLKRSWSKKYEIGSIENEGYEPPKEDMTAL